MDRKSLFGIGPRTQQDILKGKIIRKLEDGGDMFEDYWTDSDGESSTLSKRSDLSSKLDVETSKFSKTSSFKQKISHSPLKSKEVLHNVSSNIINADEIVNVNKETCATELDDTVNLEIDDDNFEPVTLNEIRDNLIRNKLNSELSNITTVVIQKLQGVDDDSLSQTYYKKDEVQEPVPKIRRSSQRSISRSTKIDARVKELQSQYNEYDEKIMQMVHMDYDENLESSIASGEESSIQQSSSIEDKRSEVEKQSAENSKNIEDKENVFDNTSQSYNESPSKSIRKNTRSLNQSLKDSVTLPGLNTDINKTQNASKCTKKEKEIVNYQTNTSGNSQLKQKSSKTFISKKTSVTKSSQIAYNSTNSHEDSYQSDSDNFSELASLEKQTNKQTTTNESSLNTQIDSPKNINSDDSDSPTKITRKQKKGEKEINLQKINHLPIQDKSKTIVLKGTSASSSKDKEKKRKKKEKNVYKNDASGKSKADVEANISDNENNISEGALKDTSDLDDDNVQTHMIKSQKTVNKKSSSILDENIFDAADTGNSHQIQTAKRRKTLINKRSNFAPEKNYPPDTSVNSFDNSEVDIEKIAKKQKIVENSISKQSIATNKSNYVHDEGIVETVDSDGSSQLHISNEQKTKNRSIQESNSRANISLKSSAESVDNTSAVNKEKAAKNQRKFEKKNKQKTVMKKNYYISDNIVETVDDDLSLLQTSKKRETRNNSIPENRLSSVNSIDNTSEVNDEKLSKKQRKIEKKNRQKTAMKKSDDMSDENIVETVDTDDLSLLQTSEKRELRNKSIPESRSPSVNSVHNTSEVNDENMSKNPRKFENKNRQKTATNKSDYISDASIKIDDPDNLSELQTSKKRKTRNNDVPEKNSLTKMSLNSSENFIDNISEVYDKRTTKNERKFEYGKSGQKVAAIKKGSHIVSNKCAAEMTEPNDLSSLQNPKRRKVKNDAPEQDLANISLNSSENSFVTIPEVKNKNTTQNCGKINNSQSMQETVKNKKSDLHTDKGIIGTKNLSQLKSSKKQNTKNNSIPEQNNLVNATSFLEKSTNSISDVNIMKNSEKQNKVEKNKSSHFNEKNDNEHQRLSKAKASGKSKSTMQKSNSDKAHEKSNRAVIPRRSARERYAPLARWRNERLLYGFKDGNIETIGIDKGTQEDVAVLKALNKKFLCGLNKGKVKKPPKTKLLDVIEGKEKSIYLQTKFPLVPWEIQGHSKNDENSEFMYSIKRMVDTTKSSFGYIKVGVGRKKPSQFMPNEDLQLVLLDGEVEINVCENVYTLERKDMFVVPRGSAYSIANIGTRQALLSYAVGTFNFLNCI